MRVVVAFAVLGGCWAGADVECTPNPWRSEVWVNDPRTGQIEAMLREGCNDFPDTETEYRVIGRRPGGSWELLLEGGLEHWERRHAVIPLDDGTSEISIWNMTCRPAGEHFTCTQGSIRFP